ncbi:MAG: hypothetical protein AB7U83_10400 [Vicinamibacterales bacterium]
MTPPLDPAAEIRRLYFATSKRTIAADLARAIDLLTQLPDEAARERVAVFMDGLSQLRSEWAGGSTPRRAARSRPGARPRPGRQRD